MDANYISERLSSMRHEISDLRATTARYWSKDQHTGAGEIRFRLTKGTFVGDQAGSVRHAETLRLNLSGFPSQRPIIRAWGSTGQKVLSQLCR
jgi:hypothetical protein